MSNDYLSFLQRLKEEREQRNLTQQRLCGCMKMQQSHYSRAEAGNRRLSYREMKALCASGVDIFYVFTGKKLNGGQEFMNEPPEISLDEAVCYLNTIYILVSSAWSLHPDHVPFENICKQSEYVKCGNEGPGAEGNVFCYVRTEILKDCRVN